MKTLARWGKLSSQQGIADPVARRFKSCHPDGVVAGQSLTGDESGEALMVFGQILDPRSSRGLCVGRWRTRAIGGGA